MRIAQGNILVPSGALVYTVSASVSTSVVAPFSTNDYSQSWTSQPIWLGHMIYGSVMFGWPAKTSGSWQCQYSDDVVNNSQTTQVVPANWYTHVSYSFHTVSASVTSPRYVDLSPIGAAWMRWLWVPNAASASANSGSVTSSFILKGFGT